MRILETDAAGVSETPPGGGLSGRRAAVVHDWLPVYAGAERVLEEILRVVDPAEVYTLIEDLPADQRGFLGGRPVRTSFIQRMPFGRTRYKLYLPLAPLAIESFDLTAYDVVVSSSYVVAKGALTTADQLHVSYVHSPVRYAWDLHFEYLRAGGYDRGARGVAARALLHYLRSYDVASASRPDLLVANSEYVARRVWKTYRRPSTVVHPPVDVSGFGVDRDHDGYYVTCSRLVPYKRVDLLVDAFRGMPDRELLVIGDGPEFGRLERSAPSNVRLLGRQPQEALEHYLRRARAFVFAAREDFGIAPVEAQACGTPVVAFGRGGALETVVDGETGVFFETQTPEAVRNAVERLDRLDIEPERVRAHAEQFSAARFRDEFGTVLERAWAAFERGGPQAVEAIAGTPTTHSGDGASVARELSWATS